jgi:hypothetical protein
LWGSPFSKEIEAGGIFYHNVAEKDQCEYLIETNGESPGFLTVSDSNIEFHFFDSISAEVLLKRLIDECMAWAKEKYT